MKGGSIFILIFSVNRSRIPATLWVESGKSLGIVTRIKFAILWDGKGRILWYDISAKSVKTGASICRSSPGRESQLEDCLPVWLIKIIRIRRNGLEGAT